MRYRYRTSGTCSSLIEFDLDGDTVSNIKFTDGCNGNLQAVSILADGMTVDEIEKKLGGIRCGFKPTSCGDQFARAVRAAKDARTGSGNQA